MNSKAVFALVHILNVKLLGCSNECFRCADFGVKAAP